MGYILKQYQKISIKVLLTIIYILILSLVIIYFRFPYKKYFGNFISRLENTTYTKISLKNIDYRFPNKIDIQNIIIKKEINEHNLQLIKADKFIGKIKLLPLLTANLGFNYQANLYNGEIDGSIYIKILGEKNGTEISAQMKDLDISQYDLLSQLLI